MQEELRAHIEHRADDFELSGLRRAEAERPGFAIASVGMLALAIGANRSESKRNPDRAAKQEVNHLYCRGHPVCLAFERQSLRRYTVRPVVSSPRPNNVIVLGSGAFEGP